MTANKPLFHRQFYRAYFVLLLALVFLAAATVTLINVREHHYQQQLVQQLPQIKQGSEQLLNLRAVEQHLYALNNAYTGHHLVEHHQALLKQLSELSSKVKKYKKNDFPYFANPAKSNQIIRIAGKDEINRKISQTAKKMLDGIVTKFDALIELKIKRADELYNLIANELAGEYTTRSRAKAYAKLIEQLQQDKQALSQLNQLAEQISLLNLQTADGLIEQLNATSDSLLTWFEGAKKSIASDDQALFEQLEQLSQVLVIDERLIAKWRGHLRVYREHQQIIQAQQVHLTELAKGIEATANRPLGDISADELLPMWIRVYATAAGIKLNHQTLQLTLLIVICFAIAMIMLVVMWLNRRIQASAANQINFIEQCLEGEETPKLYHDEQVKIHALLSQVVKPEFSAADVKNMQAAHEQALASLQETPSTMTRAENEIATLNGVIETLTQQKFSAQDSFSAEINHRVIQAMLQSQAESLTRKTELSSLYRPLYRMLLWGNENQLKAAISQADFQLSLVDCVLQHQVLSSLTNLTTEFKGQKNQYQFDDKLPHPLTVQLDPILFNAVILGVARIMIARQRHSELSLSANLIDKNDGQYVIRYQFSLCSEQKNHLIPRELSVLQTANIDEQDSDKGLLSLLFQRLFIRDVSLDKIEKGYQFSFELPHTAAAQTNHEPAVTSLNEQAFLYLTNAQSMIEDLVINAIEKHQGHVSVISAQDIVSALSVENLSIKPISAIVTCDLSHFNVLTDHVENLPNKLQPAIYCLAGKAHLLTSLAYGFFDQLSFPFNQRGFIQGLSHTLTAKKQNNLAMADSHLSKDKYINTGTEVLLAAANYQDYIVLYQQLNYLGFSVTLAANETEMLNLWRSGRYLILCSEFDLSPFIELANGKQVNRGIVALTSALYERWQDDNKASNWQLHLLEPLCSTQEVSHSLATWVVEKEKTTKRTVKPAPVKPVINTPVEIVSIDDNISFGDIPAVFDIHRYAKNQAGPENAAMMLDDYLHENTELVQKLNYALSVKSTEHINEHLARLTLNANILAADNLHALCLEMAAHLSAQEYHACQTLMIQIMEEIQLINHFAQAI